MFRKFPVFLKALRLSSNQPGQNEWYLKCTLLLATLSCTSPKYTGLVLLAHRVPRSFLWRRWDESLLFSNSTRCWASLCIFSINSKRQKHGYARTHIQDGRYLSMCSCVIPYLAPKFTAYCSFLVVPSSCLRKNKEPSDPFLYTSSWTWVNRSCSVCTCCVSRKPGTLAGNVYMTIYIYIRLVPTFKHTHSTVSLIIWINSVWFVLCPRPGLFLYWSFSFISMFISVCFR